MKDYYLDIQTDQLYRRIGFLILFGIVLNLLLFFGCAYLENEITQRIFISTYTIYCAFLGLFHICIYKKSMRNFVKTTFTIFIIGLLLGLIYMFLVFAVSFGVAIIAFLVALIVYVFFILVILKLSFNIKPAINPALVTLLFFLAEFKIISIMQNYTGFYYGFVFICAIWSFNIHLTVLLFSDTVFDKSQDNLSLNPAVKNEINVEKFENYVKEKFESKITYYEIFNHYHLFDIDCFSENCKHKLTIQISNEDIKFSTVTKEPSVDFSLYDYVIETNKEAEDFIEHILKFGWPKDLE